jgi:hypothetical protein
MLDNIVIREILEGKRESRVVAEWRGTTVDKSGVRNECSAGDVGAHDVIKHGRLRFDRVCISGRGG